MNYDPSLVDEIFELIDTKLESTSVVLPYQKGNSIRIGKYAIRKNARGYQIYDCANNARIAVTNFKISAVAIAKSLLEGKNSTQYIIDIDKNLLKHYNDAVYYRKRMKSSDDFTVIESRQHRLDLTIARSRVLKRDLDRFIF